jgi:putative ABC transport system permease protein
MSTLRFAFRALRKSPGFTAVAVVALALGIGANTAIFSLVQAIFLRPLPYAQPERILQLTSSAPERRLNRIGFSWPRLQAVRERQHVFSDISVSIATAFTVTGSGDPEQAIGFMVSSNYFSLLGAQPELGRAFLPDEDRPGGPLVVMLSHRYWQDHFGGRTDVVGQSLTLDGKPYTVIGVLPERVSSFPMNQIALFTARPLDAP